MARVCCGQLADEAVKDADALAKRLLPADGLPDTLRQFLRSDLNALNKQRQRFSVQLLNVCIAPCKGEKTLIVLRCVFCFVRFQCCQKSLKSRALSLKLRHHIG